MTEQHHRAHRPPKVHEQHDRSNAVARTNAAIAVAITKGVGSMWCAYAFCALALVGLPAALDSGAAAIVQWVAQTFLQLVLLSVIMVGQNVSQKAADARAEATYRDTETLLAKHELLLDKHEQTRTELAAVSAALVTLREIAEGAAASPDEGRRARFVELRARPYPEG